MKKEKEVKEINEAEYKDIVIKCTTCGSIYNTFSVTKSIKIDVCSNCHPFYTGKMTSGSIDGRVDKFNKKYKKN